jgi:hypothetical protein
MNDIECVKLELQARLLMKTKNGRNKDEESTKGRWRIHNFRKFEKF